MVKARSTRTCIVLRWVREACKEVAIVRHTCSTQTKALITCLLPASLETPLRLGVGRRGAPDGANPATFKTKVYLAGN